MLKNEDEILESKGFSYGPFDFENGDLLYFTAILKN